MPHMLYVALDIDNAVRRTAYRELFCYQLD